jgi:hypothetical protein
MGRKKKYLTETLNMDNTALWKVLNGKYKQTKGYVFK